MKITLLSVFAFACVALAAPVPASIPSRIQKLEVTIVEVAKDLEKGYGCLQKDYQSGLDQYRRLVDDLSGPEPCNHLASFQPKSEELALGALLNSRKHLLSLLDDYRSDLKKRDDISQAVLDSSSHPNICSAYARYRAVKPYIDTL